jgi:hypothetical protein
MTTYGSKDVTSISPWNANDVVKPTDVRQLGTGDVIKDELHTRFRLPRPGSPSNAVRLPDLIIFNPTNTGSCPCSIFIASLDASGHRLGGIELPPGASQRVYQAEPGAAVIAAACSSGCTFPDCFSELTIDNPVS